MLRESPLQLPRGGDGGPDTRPAQRLHGRLVAAAAARASEEEAAAGSGPVRVAEDLLPAIVRGAVRPLIDRVFALDEVEAAHQHVYADRQLGKVVIRI